MSSLSGKRVAILGLGRSGLAIARACLAHGAKPTVYDRATPESIAKPEVLEEARSEGIALVLGWNAGTGAWRILRPEERLVDPMQSPVRHLQSPTGEADFTRLDPTQIDLLVTNPAIDHRNAVLQRAAADGVEILSEVEFAYRISMAPILAITGTNGKSTTTVMTYLVLKACGEEAVLCGNIFGSGYPEQPLTEAALNATADQVLVAEVSSFQLEWVSQFRPVAAAITGIWEDHLDRYDSFDHYAHSKHRIFAGQGPEEFAIVRANDPVVKAPDGSGLPAYRPRSRRGPTEASARPGHPQTLTFGASGQHALVEADALTVLDTRIPNESLPFTEPHNFQNAAAAALLAFGYLAWRAEREPESNAASVVSAAEDAARQAREAKRTVYSPRLSEPPPRALPPAIVEGLRSFRGLAHRMELVGERDGIRIINNSMCTNPDAVIKSATAIREPKRLLIGGANKELDFGPLRAYLASGGHPAYIYGRDREVISQMLGGSFPTYVTMEEAFAAAIAEARPGEVVMLSPGCASTDQFRDFRDRGDVFKKIATDWLQR